jgi:uncharacterized membrane protein
MEEIQGNMGQPPKKISTSKKILIPIMIACFAIMFLTGILKFRELLRPFNIPYNQLPMQQISVVHDRAGVLLLLLIIVHLILNRSRFASAFKRKDTDKKPFVAGSVVT